MQAAHFVSGGHSNRRVQILARGLSCGVLALMVLCLTAWTGASAGSSQSSDGGSVLQSALRKDLVSTWRPARLPSTFRQSLCRSSFPAGGQASIWRSGPLVTEAALRYPR